MSKVSIFPFIFGHFIVGEKLSKNRKPGFEVKLARLFYYRTFKQRRRI